LKVARTRHFPKARTVFLTHIVYSEDVPVVAIRPSLLPGAVKQTVAVVIEKLWAREIPEQVGVGVAHSI
jgi:hypothetical protein